MPGLHVWPGPQDRYWGLGIGWKLSWTSARQSTPGLSLWLGCLSMVVGFREGAFLRASLPRWRKRPPRLGRAESQDRYRLASLALLWPCDLRATALRRGESMCPSVRGWGCKVGRKNLQPSLTSHCDQQMIVEYETEFHRHASSRELAPGEDWGLVNGTVSPLPKQHCSPASLTACGDPPGPKPSNTACDWWCSSSEGRSHHGDEEGLASQTRSGAAGRPVYRVPCLPPAAPAGGSQAPCSQVSWAEDPPLSPAVPMSFQLRRCPGQPLSSHPA